MKFLVLALCVYAVAAATVEEEVPLVRGAYKPTWQAAKAVAQVAQPAAQAFVQTVAEPFVQAAKAVKSVYNGQEVDAPVITNEYESNQQGYIYKYQTGNGISGQASGSLKKVDNVDTLVSQGSYGYVQPDGTPFELSYVADENGYQPRSNALPVGPPTPEAILRALEYIRTNPAYVEPTRRQ